MEQDKELKAMSDIITALDGLDDDARKRVIDYVLVRLKLTGGTTNAQVLNSATSLPSERAEMTERPAIVGIDIRTLKEQKQPKSAIQMAVLVAYYLQEIAPIAERQEQINTNDITRYFKQASYDLPTGKNGAADTLNNAKKAGYLEAGTVGAYKLNPVGYNLVMRLPENPSTTSSKKRGTKKSGKKK